ncbi:MAG: AAA family ATPase [Lachnospiraceae bacterium]|nr:AAA family ATPase [Lachnospiraceae bacterium]
MKMNDYKFGNYIYDLRKNAGISQSELAKMLGVTNKAVSKWENGNAKPRADILRKIAFYFKISVEDLLTMREEKTMEISKIVVTGGPCAGKSTAMSWLQNAFTQKGYRVLFVPETATELITGGVAPWTCGSNLDYQICQIGLQMEKERIFEQAARTMGCDKVLIVCDRGVIDNKAYMTEMEFQQALTIMKQNEVELRDSYDAVFHLVTAAKGAEKYYTTANNTARKETVEEATALDDKIIAAWTGHPHLRIINNSSDFENKMKRLIAEISAFLGEPEPFEIERKFLIHYPDITWLESISNCQRVEIIQTYLISKPGEEIRVRQRGMNGNYIYFQTSKRSISDLKRVEIERRLSKDEYLTLLMDADPTKRQIRKTRYCLTFENQYFEIDVYPFWKDQAIVEIELRDENMEIVFPEQIKVIKEVTGDEAYKNASLAAIESK